VTADRLQLVACVAQRQLQQLYAAREFRDLAAFPGNRPEPPAGDRREQHSIRVNNQYRICCVWTAGDAENAAIVDYHERSRERPCRRVVDCRRFTPESFSVRI
jgi:proteic killer suppression protein